MADIKFSEFQKATISKDSDEIAILQDGVNKMIPSPVLESKIINKTVSRVIEQGGASLNVINLKGVVPTYADLATITPTPELNDAYQVEADGFVYVYTETGFQAEGDGFVVQPAPTGVVEEGNTESVSGGDVYLSLQPIYNEIEGGDFLVGNSGNIADYSIAITQEYCEVNLTPSISSGKINEIKLIVSKTGLIRVAVFQDETPDGNPLNVLRNMGEVELNCEVLGVNIFTDFGGLQIEEGWYLGVRKMTGGALPYATIKANGCARAASTTVPIVGNTANMGFNNYEFAIEGIATISGIKSDIESLTLELEDALKLEDLEIKYNINLLNPENRILDQYIDSAGNIITGVTGWELAFIDVSRYPVGQEITFNGINIGTGHAAWYNEATKLAYAGSYTTASQPITYVKPENATLLYITTMRGGVVNPEIMVNLGAEALPYVPYENPYIDKIAGIDIKSGGDGEAYNQSLNTTDNVKFQSLEIQAFKAFLPTSDVGLEVGDVWVDIANSNVLKVK